jgi:exosortase A-associated hydrolase 2
VKEDFRFLELNGEAVFAAYHAPDSPASRAIVMCHPLGEEKLWAHRVFVSFARELSSAGIAVLRFDFRGEGDSERGFSESDFESRIQDACFAVDSLRELSPKVTEVTLLGLRFGASVAAAAAARLKNVARLVLWDPVLDGAAYMQSVLRWNLMFQMALHQKVVEPRDVLVTRLLSGGTVNIEGYDMSARLFEQASEFRLPAVLKHVNAQTLIVQINQGDNPVKPELAALADGRRDLTIAQVNEEPFWREIKVFCQHSASLTAVTRNWLLPASM